MGEGRHRARIQAARVIETVATSGTHFERPPAGARRVGVRDAPSGIARRATCTPPMTPSGVPPRLGVLSTAPRAAMAHLPPGPVAARETRP
jgi:hypothetical protein